MVNLHRLGTTYQCPPSLFLDMDIETLKLNFRIHQVGNAEDAAEAKRQSK